MEKSVKKFDVASIWALGKKIAKISVKGDASFNGTPGDVTTTLDEELMIVLQCTRVS